MDIKILTEPDVDDDKFADETCERAVNVYALEFDWIFNNTEGYGFLKILSKTKDIELFDVKVVTLILDFFWSIYFKRLILY